jgi:hypothetical protein
MMQQSAGDQQAIPPLCLATTQEQIWRGPGSRRAVSGS